LHGESIHLLMPPKKISTKHISYDEVPSPEKISTKHISCDEVPSPENMSACDDVRSPVKKRRLDIDFWMSDAEDDSDGPRLCESPNMSDSENTKHPHAIDIDFDAIPMHEPQNSAQAANVNSSLSFDEWFDRLDGDSVVKKNMKKKIKNAFANLSNQAQRSHTGLEGLAAKQNETAIGRADRVRPELLKTKAKRSWGFRHHLKSWTIPGTIRGAFAQLGSRVADALRRTHSGIEQAFVVCL
jgi:hypothetical protein